MIAMESSFTETFKEFNILFHFYVNYIKVLTWGLIELKSKYNLKTLWNAFSTLLLPSGGLFI